MHKDKEERTNVIIEKNKVLSVTILYCLYSCTGNAAVQCSVHQSQIKKKKKKKNIKVIHRFKKKTLRDHSALTTIPLIPMLH
jgi:hypothetical protein